MRSLWRRSAVALLLPAERQAQRAQHVVVHAGEGDVAVMCLRHLLTVAEDAKRLGFGVHSS